MIRNRIAWAVVAALIVIAAIVWRSPDPAGESDGQVGAVNPDRALVESMLERTRRESRTGVEDPVSEAPPEAPGLVDAAQREDDSQRDVSESEAAAPESGLDPDLLPEGYTLGAYRGAMQRAPLTSAPEPELSPNPAWLEPGSSPDEILDRAEGAGREFTFAVLRARPGTDLQALNRSLAALGARVEGSTGSYVRVRVPAERDRLDAIAGLDDILGIGAVPPELKADEAFVQEMLARPASEAVPVYITLMAQDLAGEWRQALTELGVVVGAYDRDLRSYTANLTPAALAPILDADFVLSVEPVPAVTTNHASSVPVMGVDGFRQYDPVTKRFSGTTGSGIAVGVLDTGLNTSHADIAHGRASICGANLAPDETWDLWLDLHGHGTHVFGTIAGAGRIDPALAGIAPGLSHLRFGKVLSYRGLGTLENIRRGMDYLAHPTNCVWQGARSDTVKPLIVNMSLAAVALTFSGRGVGERKLDSVVHAHSQLYVVAQANSGLHGFSNFGTAKNSLAVGAVDDTGIIAWFSSHGPTADGRLAPNVVGTGVSVTSARGGAATSSHRTFSGTSMASPSVAGVAALLMEARPEFQNQPALTRARLMASAIRPHVFLESRAQLPADNTDGPGEFNNLYGLGLVSAQTTLFSRDGAEGWLIGSASAEPDNDSYEYIDIEVPEGAGRLDVVLTWDEQPADTLTRSVLNNLDLWADAGADCSEEACGEHSSRSEIDNVEWLLIEDPVPGAYRIKVVPVEVYGEPSTAAVAWKILRGEPTPELRVEVEDTSSDADSQYITVDVTVDADRYVASGTNLHLSCLSRSSCGGLPLAYLPYRTRVHRSDGLDWSDPDSPRSTTSIPLPIGEVAAGTPRRVQLRFLRTEVPAAGLVHVTASSWNARAAGQSLAVGTDATETETEFVVPANDSFSGSEHIEGATGATLLEFALASREPGEPRVTAVSRTLWYRWEAPANGLFRFRLEDATGDGYTADAEFAIFRGASLGNLELEAEKLGEEVSFAARAGAIYYLRIASDKWFLPQMMLSWEPADLRPANDDFAFAQVLEGASGSLESTNEGATLEGAEFQGGAAATVWFEWTAPSDGSVQFSVAGNVALVNVFVGTNLGELRLVTYPHGIPRIRVEAGETYRIAVAAESADSSGTPFTLRWHSTAEPPSYRERNDYFDDAIEIEGASGREETVVLTTGRSAASYTVEPGEPIESGITTAWWQWIAPSDGRVTWRMDGSPSYRLTVFSGDVLRDLQFVGTLTGGSALVQDAVGGSRYWIAVGRSPEYLDKLRLSTAPVAFTWGPTPANDDREAASSIVGAAGSAAAVLSYATPAFDEPAENVGTDSVWWRWTAPASGWQRFRVDGDPLSAILSVYPDSASVTAVGDSERSFMANGRVEITLLVRAGQSYDIRLATRPRVTTEPSATLRWEASEAPAALAFKRAITLDSLAANPLANGMSSPFNLAIDDEGDYLFGSAYGGLMAFVRDSETGELALAYRASAGPDADAYRLERLQRANLWWNSSDDRLFVHTADTNESFAVPDDGSTSLSRTEITMQGGEFPFSTSAYPGAVSPDGRHFYAMNHAYQRLQGFRIDSPLQLTHVYTVSAEAVPGEDLPVVPDIDRAEDMTFSADGLYLYVLRDTGLAVFSRDPSSGTLQLVRDYPHTRTPDSPIHEIPRLRNVSLDGTGTILVVSGRDFSTALSTTLVAFDISTDPSNPQHLDTLSGMYFEQDREVFRAPSHLRSHLFQFLHNCYRVVPHPGRSAVDVFCAHGFFVVNWNSATAALEVTDLAASGMRDRFGNEVPFHLGGETIGRQLAQSPDGAHVYRATSLRDREFTDAIHVYERASAMAPDEAGQATGGDVAEPVDPTEPTEPAQPDEPTGGGNEATPDPDPAADCYVGLLVGIGERCTYPGTTDEFSVNVRGRASFLGRLAGIRIRITNETIDGRVYNFEARHQGEGVWRINVVGESM